MTLYYRVQEDLFQALLWLIDSIRSDAQAVDRAADPVEKVRACRSDLPCGSQSRVFRVYVDFCGVAARRTPRVGERFMPAAARSTAGSSARDPARVRAARPGGQPRLSGPSSTVSCCSG